MDNTVFKRIIESIDGNVQSRGIKTKFVSWMVIGSREWEETTDEIKAHAFQAALYSGWNKNSLIKAVCAVYEHIDVHMANFTISFLEELSKTHLMKFESSEKEKPKVTIFGKTR